MQRRIPVIIVHRRQRRRVRRQEEREQGEGAAAGGDHERVHAGLVCPRDAAREVGYQELADFDALGFGSEHEGCLPVGVAGDAFVFVAGVDEECLVSPCVSFMRDNATESG